MALEDILDRLKDLGVDELMHLITAAKCVLDIRLNREKANPRGGPDGRPNDAWYVRQAAEIAEDVLDHRVEADGQAVVKEGNHRGKYVSALIWVRDPKCELCGEFVGECVCERSE